MKNYTKLIQCGDHSYAPWGVVCTHIIEGSASEIVQMNPDEGSNDWLCTECAKEMNIENMECVCIHCIRKFTNKYKGDK